MWIFGAAFSTTTHILFSLSLSPGVPLSHSQPDALSAQPELLAHAPGPKKSPAVLPLALLLLVPVAWGTYGVAIKSLFALDVPPPVRAA